jgi:hypothetical protein
MLTPEEDIEAQALRKRGWTISAIARHLGRDRKTVRAYLNGVREPGVRKASDLRTNGASPRTRCPAVLATVSYPTRPMWMMEMVVGSTTS